MKKIKCTELVVLFIAFLLANSTTFAQHVETNAFQKQSKEPLLFKSLEMRTGTGAVDYNTYIKRQNEVAGFSLKKTLGLRFESIGPNNLGGQTRAIIELYGDSNKLLAGSVNGGLFKSDDGGISWIPAVSLSNNNISCIHQDTNSGVIYVGTGSSFSDFYSDKPGNGIYKSEDGGESFQHIESTSAAFNASNGYKWRAVNRISTDTEGNIYAATLNGLSVSADDGETWIEDLLPFAGQCADVTVSAGNKILVSYSSGPLFLSKDGLKTEFIQLNNHGLPTSSRRTCVTSSPYLPDIMYVMYVGISNCIEAIYKTEDGGDNWFKIASDQELAPIQSSGNCYGSYNASFLMAPRDPYTLYLGGRNLWRYDIELRRLGSTFGPIEERDSSSRYMHTGIHFIYASPNNSKKVYVTNESGITRTIDRGNNWQGINNGYATTQFFDIAFDNDDQFMTGSTIDNGSLMLKRDALWHPYSVTSNIDEQLSFQTEISQYTGYYFATGTIGRIYRAREDESLKEIGLDPFHPTVRVLALWENSNDITSKDSIQYTLDRFYQIVGTGNGLTNSFQWKVTQTQPEAKIIDSTFMVRSGDQTLFIESDGKTLSGNGNGTIKINDNGSFELNLSFSQAPDKDESIEVSYEARFEANSILLVESENFRSTSFVKKISHRLESDLEPGDQLIIQDKAQSLLAADLGDGITFFRNVLSNSKARSSISIQSLPNNIEALCFTPNGNHLFIGSINGMLTRVDNLQELYTEDDVDKLEDISLGSFSGGVGGIALDPNNPNRGIVTSKSFGGGAKVSYSTNILSNSPTFIDVTGNLPFIPVYVATFNLNDPNMVLIGTEFGVFGTADIEAPGGPVWSKEDASLGSVPVFTIKQQQLPWADAKNSGKVFVGTYGKGMWVTTDLVGINEINHINLDKDDISSVYVHPNPMNTTGRVEFDAAENGNLAFNIYDLSGRHIRNWNERVSEGTNLINFETSDLRSGNYFMTIGNGNNVKTAKFMVLH